ncbi:Fc.00g101850.m01.CDS01 [Cosmosporella sp. VM-42]
MSSLKGSRHPSSTQKEEMSRQESPVSHARDYAGAMADAGGGALDPVEQPRPIRGKHAGDDAEKHIGLCYFGCPAIGPAEVSTATDAHRKGDYAVPKKRGPKTDVLEALLKRVDGLEAKLREKNEEETSPTAPTSSDGETAGTRSQYVDMGEPASKRIAIDTQASPGSVDTTGFSPCTPVTRELDPNPVQMDSLLDTYFTRFHAKPYYILDESSIRQRLQLNKLPNFLCYAISAVAARYTPNPNGYQAAVKLSEDFATRSRNEINTDEPSIDALQALLLLVSAFTASGKGKKAYMLMSSATGMAMALEIHREMDSQARVTPVERELRRRLFWTCYLLDRFQTTGSKRPCLINDDAIILRLPSWSPNSSSLPVEGEFFQPGSNLQYYQGSGKKSQGSTGMLIDITRILGITSRYLAAGGVKGDSHFPWHSLSILSKIRHDLDIWASGTEDVFSSLSSLFGQADSTVLVLSKLIYHLIHCLVYRPFLPIDLAELAGNGQHQSWQIEATNMCFLHANAIAELIELGNQASTIEWPAFVGYCICTAGTVHIHGAHYSKQGANGENVFSSAADFLSREVQQLNELRYAWACVRHQSETLQVMYNAHSELVKTLTTNSMRYTPGFHNEDFFDRYSNIGGPGGQSYSFDTANLSLSDISVDSTLEVHPGRKQYVSQAALDPGRPRMKRKNTAPSGRKRPDMKALATFEPPPTPALPTPGQPRRSYSYTAGMIAQSSPGLLTTPTSLHPHAESHEHENHMGNLNDQMNETAANNAAVAAAEAAGFSLSPTTHHIPGQGMPALAGGSFRPSYNYASALNTTNNGASVINEANGGYDAMFGTLPTNAFSSPAAWHGEENHHIQFNHITQNATAPSPGTKSNNDSIGTVQGDEKDPFLTLLEQLAENEQRSNNGQGTDFDFFLSGAGVST